MTARDVWRWTDERGVQRLVGTDELRAALSTSILSSTTLVWREGMKEWTPAGSVPELAAAVDAGNHPGPEDEDLRGTQRRATLVGLASGVGEPADVLDETVPPIRLPSPAGASKPVFPKSGPITQIPPFGAPPQEPRNVVPPAPRVPGQHGTPPSRVPTKEKPQDPPPPKPYRAITMSDVDGSWGAPPSRVEDDDTSLEGRDRVSSQPPRRPRRARGQGVPRAPHQARSARMGRR